MGDSVIRKGGPAPRAAIDRREFLGRAGALALGRMTGTRARLLVALAVGAVLSVSAATIASAGTSVDCTTNPGGALSSALSSAAPGDTLRIQGTCLGTYTIDKSLTLTGKADAAIDGNGNGPVLTIAAGVHVILDRLVVKGGASVASVAVGGIRNGGVLEITRSRVIDNTADGVTSATGGIFSGPLTTASLSLDQTEVAGNRATVFATVSATAAGGIRTSGPVTIVRTEIRNNEAVATSRALVRAFGGLVINSGGGGYLDRTVINGNIARAKYTGTTETGPTGFAAGAIGGLTHFAGDHAFAIDDGVIRGNQAFAESTFGSAAVGGMNSAFGCMSCGNRQYEVSKTDVIDNLAEADTFAAGGIANLSVPLVVDKSTIKGNTASARSATGMAGGGITNGRLAPSTTTLVKSSVIQNVAAGIDAVGGLYQAAGNGSYVLDKSEVRDNTPFDCNFAGCER